MMEFSDILKSLRLEKGVTQKQVAIACTVTPTCICQLENGSRAPTGSTIKALAVYFGCTADYLLGIEDDFGVKISESPSSSISRDERQVLEDYRALPMHLQELIKSNLKTLRAAENKYKTELKAE